MFTSQQTFYTNLHQEEKERQKQQPIFGSFGGNQVQNQSTVGLFGGIFGQPTPSAFSAQYQQSTQRRTESTIFGQTNKRPIPQPEFQLDDQCESNFNRRQYKQQYKQEERGQDYPKRQQGQRDPNGNRRILGKRPTMDQKSDLLDQEIESLQQIDPSVNYSKNAKKIFYQQLGSVDLNDWIQDPLATHLEFQIKDFPTIREESRDKINYKIIRQILQNKSCFTTLGGVPDEISVNDYLYKKQREAAAIKLIMMINERRQGRKIISQGRSFRNAIIETSIEEFIDMNFETIKNAEFTE